MDEHNRRQQEIEEADVHHERQISRVNFYDRNVVNDSARAHFGDVFQSLTINVGSTSETPSSRSQQIDRIFTYVKPVGLCLGQAPYISPELFIGRKSHLEEIHAVLKPQDKSTEQRRLVLGGPGGIGKTQLAIAYARRYQDAYESIFWLNAMSEATLIASLKSSAEFLFDISELLNLSGEHIVLGVKQWLSDKKNTRWLLIFDNYDIPKSYDLQSYLPGVSHGSLIVTTRLPEQVSGHKLRVRPLDNINDGLEILETRSGRRDLVYDVDAQRLAEKLAGLPLGLATAGAYLRNSTWTFKEYLDEYNKQWDSSREQFQLSEYTNRSLNTTWDLSYSYLNAEHSSAAQLLKLLAYFNNQSIWHGLFQVPGEHSWHRRLSRMKNRVGEMLNIPFKQKLPDWLRDMIVNKDRFDEAMNTLVQYCFIEVISGSYSMHTLVHDWTLGRLNHTSDEWCYWFAFDCIVKSIDDVDWECLEHIENAQLVPHAVRLMDIRFVKVREGIAVDRLQGAGWIAQLLMDQGQFEPATVLCRLILAKKEKMLGRNHPSTLLTVNTFGILYRRQGKPAEAEEMYIRALAGQEKTRGKNHPETLDTVNNLGFLYRVQGKIAEAKEMNVRALAGREKAFGKDHPSVFQTVNHLGDLYMIQGKLIEAEEMYVRALAGKEKVLGHNHTTTLQTVDDLGVLYSIQGRMAEAMDMLTRSFTGRMEALGPDHVSTLQTALHFGRVYVKQGNLGEAERMFEYAHSKSHINEQHREAILGLGSILSKKIDVQVVNHISTQGEMIRLIRHVKQHGKADKRNFCSLARALMCVKDYENTRIAWFYYYYMDDELTKRYSMIFFCDGCDCTITLATGGYVCRQCDDNALCNMCMSKYKARSLSLTSCHGHKYYNVTAAVSRVLKSQNQMDMDTWFGHLEEKYTAQTDG